MSDDDILDITPPAHIPGVLFGQFWNKLYEQYPLSKRKAQMTAVLLLEILVGFYEEVAKEEQP